MTSQPINPTSAPKKRGKLKWIVLGAVVVVGIAIASQAGKDSGTVTDTAPTGSNATGPGTAAASTTPSGNPRFGQTWTDQDGLSVTIGKPTSFKPGKYSLADDKTATYLKFEVRLVNGTAENFDPALFHATVQSGNKEAESVFDTGNGLEGAPSTTLLPGREAVWAIGFAVSDPDDLVMEVSPQLIGDNVIFTN